MLVNIKIERDAYLRHSSQLNQAEIQMRFMFNEWLPDDIIDCHAHCNLPEHAIWIDDQAYRHMLSTFPGFTLEESNAFQLLFHPEKKIRTLRFPKTFRGIDHRSANQYLLEQSSLEDRIALYGLPDDIQYTIEAMKHPRVSALKMYYSYFNPPATEIYQFFPVEILEVAQELNIPIILHTPEVITECLGQVLRLIRDFPKLRVSIAHLGLAYHVLPGLQEALEVFSKCENVLMDTSLIPSAEVTLMALQQLGINRVMYGSDAPLDLIRSKVYANPRLGLRLITGYQYHWVDADEHAQFKHLAEGLIHDHWQTLLAAKGAIEKFPKKLQPELKRKIFHDNACGLFGF